MATATTADLIRRRVRTGHDPMLAARLRTGDPDAFAQAYRRHNRRLARLIAAQLPDEHRDEVQDLIQDTFCAAIAAPTAFRTDDVYAVLRALALHACTNRDTAATMTRCTGRAIAAASPVPGGGEDTDACPAPMPAALASYRDLRAAVATLAPPQRRVIELLYLDGHPNAAVARLMRRPASAVAALRERGLAQLREYLAGTDRAAGPAVAQH
jgi:RNA polymerase sigma-70 factor (ECF subfamily)